MSAAASFTVIRIRRKWQKNISKMRRADSAVFYCVGNRLPVYGTGAKQRKAKRFVAAYLRGTEVSRN